MKFLGIEVCVIPHFDIHLKFCVNRYIAPMYRVAKNAQK